MYIHYMFNEFWMYYQMPNRHPLRKPLKDHAFYFGRSKMFVILRKSNQIRMATGANEWGGGWGRGKGIFSFILDGAGMRIPHSIPTVSLDTKMKF